LKNSDYFIILELVCQWELKGGRRLQVLVGARIYTPLEVYAPGALVVEGERISWVGPEAALPAGYRRRAQVVAVRGKAVIPGLIDLHAHGGLGLDFSRAEAEDIGRLVAFHRARGTTGLLASVCGLNFRETLAALERLAAACRAYPGLLGIHLEGPYVASLGCLPKEAQRLPQVEEVRAFAQAAAGRLKVMTLAPELPGVQEVVAELLRLGVVPAAGHTEVDYAGAQVAFSQGVGYITHMFNAMSGFHHRQPGIVGAVFESRVWVEVIADGVHVHPAVLRLLWRLVGPERLILVSDASPGSGWQPKGRGMKALPSAWGRLKVEDGRVVDEQGRLAGGWQSLLYGVFCFQEAVGCGLGEALRLASLNPAAVLGLRGELGSLAPGKAADFVVLGEDRHPELVFCRGKLCGLG